MENECDGYEYECLIHLWYFRAKYQFSRHSQTGLRKIAESSELHNLMKRTPI